MEHLLERLGALFVESGVHAPGARRASCEGVESTLVEGVDGVPGSLRAASQIAGYLRRRKSTSTRQKDLAVAQNESVFGAERSPASSLSRSLFDSCRTKIGGFMEGTIAHLTHNPL